MPISKLQRSLLLGLALLACACPDTYCQSGPKYGTQCYRPDDVEAHKDQQDREER
jgi:hypothetical protein